MRDSRRPDDSDILYCNAVESWIGSAPEFGSAYFGIFSWVLDLPLLNKFHSHVSGPLSFEVSRGYASGLRVIALISS